MFCVFIYCLLWTFFLQESIKYFFNDHNFKIMAIINYLLWWLVSLYGEYNRLVNNSYTEYKILIPYCVYSLNIFYIYELYYYRPDIGHTIHHILTILLQSYCFLGNYFNSNINIVLGCSAYWSMLTSSFSALRYILRQKNSIYYEKVNELYKFLFVFLKGFTIIIYYLIVYKNITKICATNFIMIYVLYFSVHMNQLYFIYRILSK